MAPENPDEAKTGIDESKNAAKKVAHKITRPRSPTYGTYPAPWDFFHADKR